MSATEGHEHAPFIDYQNLPAPTEGILVTQFITVRSVARSHAFYSKALGGQVAPEENPCIVKLANSWVLMNPGGPPTPDKPDISVVNYEPGEHGLELHQPARRRRPGVLRAAEHQGSRTHETTVYGVGRAVVAPGLGDQPLGRRRNHDKRRAPRRVIETNLARHMDPELVARLRAVAATPGATTEGINGAPVRFKSIAQGAATSVLVATSPKLAGVGSSYFENWNEAHTLTPDAVSTASSGVAPYALDPTRPSVSGNCRSLAQPSSTLHQVRRGVCLPPNNCEQLQLSPLGGREQWLETTRSPSTTKPQGVTQTGQVQPISCRSRRSRERTPPVISRLVPGVTRPELCRVAVADVFHRVDPLGRNHQRLAGTVGLRSHAVDRIFQLAFQDVDDLFIRMPVPKRRDFRAKLDAVLDHHAPGDAQVVLLKIGSLDSGSLLNSASFPLPAERRCSSEPPMVVW